jgi:sugar lactone lactonase YvrE
MLSFVSPTDALAALIDKDQDFRLIGSGYGFTEGPAWHPVGNYLVFSDIPGDRRWRWSEAKGMELVAWPTYKGNGMAYEADGSLLVCEQVTSSLIRIRPDGAREVVAMHYQGKYLNSPNDVIVRSDGSVYFTDPNYGRWDVPVGVGRKCELDFQGVYRVPPGSAGPGGGDCELVVAKTEFEQPNGLAFSPDESIMYVNDRRDLKAYDVAPDGSLSNVRTVHDQMGSSGTPGNGNPDGMEVDALGNIWCTARGGVWVIAPSGDLLGIIETPAVSGSLVWGGEDLRSLFVCTSTTMHVIRTLVGPAPIPFSVPGA